MQRILITGLGNHQGPRHQRHNAGLLALDYLVDHFLGDGTPTSAAAQWTASSQMKGSWCQWKGTVGVVPLGMNVGGMEKLLDRYRDKENRIVPNDNNNNMEETQSVQIYFFKPKTYMNLSGESVLKSIKQLKIPPQNVYVIHDELQKRLGSIGVKRMGSANGHNGIESVQIALKHISPATTTPLEFTRFRVGIDRPPNTNSLSTRQRDTAVTRYVLGKFTPKELEVLHREAFPVLVVNVLKEVVKVPFEKQDLGVYGIKSL